MKTHRLLLSCLLLCLAAVPVLGGGEAVILYPPDLTLTTEAKLKVSAFSAGGNDPLGVKVNGQAAGTLEGEAFRAGEVALMPGFNLLETGGKTIRVFFLQDVKLDVFRLPTENSEEPLVFTAYRRHPALDDGCEGCHTVKDGKLGAKDQKEACYACHDNFEAPEEGKTKFVHNPVSAGECTSCHDPHFAARPKLQKLEKGCYECHDPFPKTESVHYPVAEGHCTACHDPHRGPAPKQLLRPGNDLCRGCHKDPHPRHRSPEVRGAMTEVPTDFPKYKGELACLGCHVPHQSAERRLFRKSQGDLCKTCHLV